MKQKILIVGSSNTDMVIKADHLPAPGETILGGTFLMTPGGKGANSAVAAARLGADVIFICKTGDDLFGRQSVQLFQQEGIDTSYILSDSDAPSGVALITVDRNAENCIVVASGANATLSVADLAKAEKVIGDAALVLMQLEIPIATVEYVTAIAFAKGITVILNPAPACGLQDDLLRQVKIITPNKTEAEMLTGIRVTDIVSAKKAASVLSSKGVETVIITLGNEGALVLTNNVFTHVAAMPVEAIDSTAAGDVFNGALAVALSQGYNIIAATEFACIASAISVTRLGAQSSVPYIQEVDAVIKAQSKAMN
jgi:ribokinase